MKKQNIALPQFPVGSLWFSLKFNKPVVRIIGPSDDDRSVAFVLLDEMEVDRDKMQATAGWWYHSADLIVPLNINAGAVFTPYSIPVNDEYEHEMMKSIFHLCHKVADSSYFDLDFTPDREDVREYMRKMHRNLLQSPVSFEEGEE